MAPHGDFDHMREAINLVNKFKVDIVKYLIFEYEQFRKNQSNAR